MQEAASQTSEPATHPKSHRIRGYLIGVKL